MRSNRNIARCAACAGVCLALAAGWTASARAAAEVHKFSIVLSAVPTSVAADDFNANINNINQEQLVPRGLNGIDQITSAWFYQGELRYFVRSNFAVSAGVGQLRNQTKREYLPALQEDVQLRVEMLSVPIHVGGAYYFTPYNAGDFQARVYLGAGFMSLVHNRVRLQVNEVAPSGGIFGGSFLVTGRGDAPGYYTELGVHMFFAARFSALIGAVYRSARVRDIEAVLVPEGGGTPENLGNIGDLDTSGIGARMGVGIGF